MAYLQRIKAMLPALTDDEDVVFNDGGPMSPPFKDRISMQFDANVLIDGFLQNLTYREAILKKRSWILIIDYFSKDQEEAQISVSVKIGIQILFLLSKMDWVRDLYSRKFDIVAPLLSGFKADVLGDRETKEARDLLTRPIFVKAFTICMNEVEKECDEDDVRKIIRSMVIYRSNADLSLRGCCLCDGIFVNFDQLYHGKDKSKMRADYVTLLCDETTHFLARTLWKDYNFSSPFTGVPIGSTRKESGAMLDRNLELGRSMELKLFNLQPDWASTPADVAVEFLQKIDDPLWGKLPVIDSKYLVGRAPERISSAFGIDFPIENDFLIE